MGKTIHTPRYQKLLNELMNERIRLNISQSEIASKVGLNQSDISKIEKLERRLDVLEFARILDALRIHDNPRLQQVVKEFTGLKND